MPSQPETPADVVARLVEYLAASDVGDDEWTRTVASLKDLGFFSVPYLIDALVHEKTSVRRGAAKALASMGQIVVPDLMAALKHPEFKVRLEVALLLYGKAQHTEQLIADLIPVLTEAMHDPDGPVRYRAIQALSNFTDRREIVLPVFIAALKDSDDMVREWAAVSLGGFGAEAEDALPALTEALLDDDWAVRKAANEAVNRIQGNGCPDEEDEE